MSLREDRSIALISVTLTRKHILHVKLDIFEKNWFTKKIILCKSL